MKFLLALACVPCLMGQGPVFKENFESGKIDPTVWDQRVAGGATIAVEPVDGAHGKYSLHVHYPDQATGSYAFLVATHLPPSTRGHMFGRAWMKVTGAIGPTHNPLLFAGGAGWPMSKFYEIGSRGLPGPLPTFMPSFQENKSPAGQGRGEITVHSDGPIPIDKWFLLEWEFNDNPSSITLWVDGEKVTSTVDGKKIDTAKFAWPKGSDNVNGLIGGFDELGVGLRVWGKTTGFDVYYDDIAVGPGRLSTTP